MDQQDELDNPFERGRRPAANPGNPFGWQPAPRQRRSLLSLWPWLLTAASLGLWAVVAIIDPDLGSFRFRGIDSPCNGGEACLAADPEVEAVYTNSRDCDGYEICLVPLGATSVDTLMTVVAHFDDEYGLEIGILPPLDIDPELLDGGRDQISSDDLFDLLDQRYPYPIATDAILIGITPADMYMPQKSNWRYAFSVHTVYGIGSRGVVSSFRMDPETYGGDEDDALVWSRLLKMISKQIGSMYYGLDAVSDPDSAMYNNILSPADLDRMSNRLDLPAGGR